MEHDFKKLFREYLDAQMREDFRGWLYTGAGYFRDWLVSNKGAEVVEGFWEVNFRELMDSAMPDYQFEESGWDEWICTKGVSIE